MIVAAASKVPGANLPTTVVADAGCVRIPPGIVDLTAFRRWLHSGEFPEQGKVCYLRGEVWVDLSMEDFFAHNQVKAEFHRALANLVKAARLGRYVPDGMLVTNVEADLSCEPDGMFVSRHSFDAGKVRLVPGARDNLIELEGTPDMVLEIVSPSSVGKDYDRLRELYWAAGVPEYWLVDAREETLTFDLLKHGPRGYTATRKSGGWVKSAVLGKSFRLVRETDERGEPEFTLEIK
jgi:Uma2 family endonuclease